MGTTRTSMRWASWIFGVALLVAVIVVALRFSEERALVRMAERARPWWLAIAFLLQAATYLAQGEIWRIVPRAARVPVFVWDAFKLSLAKLFIDQALPTAGVSGTVVVARAMERLGVPRPVVMASVIVDNVSYYAAYALTLLLALLIMAERSEASLVVGLVAFSFVLLAAALMAGALALAGRGASGAPPGLRRVPLLGGALALLGEAQPTLARNRGLIFAGGVLQLAMVLLDAATVWVLIRSLGEVASPTGVFASFVLSTLMRTVGIVPGGLGVFEAASVVTLKVAGVPVPVALGATLLFRGLSFWLPMAPGLVFSRAVARPA